MVNSYLLTKIDVDSVNCFLENVFYGWTDGKQTPAPWHSSADTVKHS